MPTHACHKITRAGGPCHCAVYLEPSASGLPSEKKKIGHILLYAEYGFAPDLNGLISAVDEDS